jgi:hypothetical protein
LVQGTSQVGAESTNGRHFPFTATVEDVHLNSLERRLQCEKHRKAASSAEFHGNTAHVETAALGCLAGVEDPAAVRGGIKVSGKPIELRSTGRLGAAVRTRASTWLA